MRIELGHGKSVYSSHNGKLLLPEIEVTADAYINISGLPDDIPHFLRFEREGEKYVALFFLHPHVTAHVNAGDFDIYLTSDDTLIGCFICSKSGYFKVSQRKERIARYSPYSYYDFCIIVDDETTAIETIEKDRETDKHVSV